MHIIIIPARDPTLKGRQFKPLHTPQTHFLCLVFFANIFIYIIPYEYTLCNNNTPHSDQKLNYLVGSPVTPFSMTTRRTVNKTDRFRNESGFRSPLCTYRLNWARRTSWGWWDDWDDTVLQTQDSKSEARRSEVEYATSRSQRLSTILIFTRGWRRNIFCFFQTAETGSRTPNLAWKAAVLTTTLGPPPHWTI